jgi:anti-sigma factor RsiW
MNKEMGSPDCERSSDLMAFVYNEMDAGERREFESHLQQCGNCRGEAASFGLVRESIHDWRDEVLTGFVPTTARVAPRRSALAAFRQFFDLSPLWLQSAAVALTLCVLGGLIFFTLKKDNAVAVRTDARYTEQDVKRLIEEALAKQKVPPAVDNAPEEFAVVNPGRPRRAKRPAKQTARNRGPLSRAEREQLAADLRLFPTDDDLDLINDRINHEER